MKTNIIRRMWLLLAAMCFGVAHAGTVTYVYTDPQGTPLAEANASGTITATYDYTPYGQAVSGMSPAPNGPGYTGHVNDPDTGLVYMQARYYDPGRGGFLSVDPVGPSPGNIYSFNRYGYASNNPIMNIDPDGRQSTGSEYQLVAVKDSKGQVMMIPAGYAAQSMAAVQTGSNISDITNPSFDNVHGAIVLDRVQLGSTVTALASVADAPPLAVAAGGVAEVSGVLSFLMDPSPERLANVLTNGGFRVLKMSAQGSSLALKTVEQLQQSNDATDILTAVQQKLQEQRQRQQDEKKQQERPKEQRHPNDKFIGS